jgi:hypothetical protein
MMFRRIEKPKGERWNSVQYQHGWLMAVAELWRFHKARPGRYLLTTKWDKMRHDKKLPRKREWRSAKVGPCGAAQ